MTHRKAKKKAAPKKKPARPSLAGSLAKAKADAKRAPKAGASGAAVKAYARDLMSTAMKLHNVARSAIAAERRGVRR